MPRDPVSEGHELSRTAALEATRAWRAAGVPLLILAGTVGTGKSLAAAWGLWDWWAETARPNPWGRVEGARGRHWIAAPHLARLAAWSPEVLELEGRGMLVLDDLGEEEGTARSLSTISTLVTTRCAEGRPTIITTNLDGATFRGRYNERIVDRLRACGLNENGKARWWVRCAGDSLRGRVEPEPPEPDMVEEPPATLSVVIQDVDVDAMTSEFFNRIRSEKESETV